MEYTDQPFEVLRRTLTLLTTGPGQPTLPTASVKGIDAAELTAAEVLDRLRGGPQNQTDELWHRVFAHARSGESTWTVIAAGAMLPPMVTACARYARVPAQQIPDVESELLTASLEQVWSLPAQQELGQAVAGAHQFGAGVLAGPEQVAGGFLGRDGYPDGGDLVQAEQGPGAACRGCRP